MKAAKSECDCNLWTRVTYLPSTRVPQATSRSVPDTGPSRTPPTTIAPCSRSGKSIDESVCQTSLSCLTDLLLFHAKKAGESNPAPCHSITPRNTAVPLASRQLVSGNEMNYAESKHVSHFHMHSLPTPFRLNRTVQQ